MHENQAPPLQEGWNPIQLPADYPFLVGVAWAIILAGLAADAWLLAVALRKRDPDAPPFRKITEKPWGLAEVGMIVGTLCLALLLSSFLLSWAERLGDLSKEQLRQFEMLGSVVVIDGLGIAAIVLLLRSLRIRRSEAFGIVPGSLFRAGGRALFYLLAALPPVWFLAFLSEQILTRLNLPLKSQEAMQLFLESDSGLTLSTIAFTAVVAAPLFEELFFRGLVYPALKQRTGFAAALVVTSILFAAIHFHVLSFLPLTVLAIGLTLAYEATGNLLVPIVMHSVFNLMTIVCMVIVRAG